MYMNIYLSIYMFTLLKQKLLLAAVLVGGPRGSLGTLDVWQAWEHLRAFKHVWSSFPVIHITFFV